MNPSSRIRIAVVALTCAGAASPLAAQEPRVVTIGGGSNVAFAINGGVAVSDETIRGLIRTNVPEALQADEPQQVVLVLDANDQYVTSRVSKATLITGGSPVSVISLGDSAAGARVIVRRDSTLATTIGSAVGTAVSFARIGDEDSGKGVLGTGYTMTDVAGMAMKRFAAGDFGSSMLIVMIVKLK